MTANTTTTAVPARVQIFSASVLAEFVDAYFPAAVDGENLIINYPRVSVTVEFSPVLTRAGLPVGISHILQDLATLGKVPREIIARDWFLFVEWAEIAFQPGGEIAPEEIDEDEIGSDEFLDSIEKALDRYLSKK